MPVDQETAPENCTNNINVAFIDQNENSIPVGEDTALVPISPLENVNNNVESTVILEGTILPNGDFVQNHNLVRTIYTLYLKYR